MWHKSSVVLNKKNNPRRSEIILTLSLHYTKLHCFRVEDPATKGCMYITQDPLIQGKWVKEVIVIPRNW